MTPRSYTAVMPDARRRISRPKEPEPVLWDEAEPELPVSARTTQEYLKLRVLKENVEAQVDAMKRSLMEMLAAEGEVEGDEKHPHRVLTFPEEVSAGKYSVSGIKNECRVTQSLDEVAALALIKEKGLEAECLETIVVLNEDGLLAANYSKVITDEELASLYSNSESHAFVLVK